METLKLFKRQGLTAIINDHLIDNALHLASILMGLFGAGLGFIYAHFMKFGQDGKIAVTFLGERGNRGGSVRVRGTGWDGGCVMVGSGS
jgi:hypothetical protein